MADEVAVYDVVRVIDERAARRVTPASTRTEIADELGVARDVTDPLVDEARDEGYLEEHHRYRENWQLTDAGREFLDAGLFKP